MGEWVGIGRRARRCYGFDEVALVPGERTINPNEVDISWNFAGLKLGIPILAAAMDGVVDVNFAIAMGKLGGIAVLNLDGVQTRYDDPSEILKEISESSPEKATEILQKLYLPKVNEELISQRVEQIKKAKVPAVVSCIPQNAERFSKIAQEAGSDCFIVQSQVSAPKHISKEYKVCDYGKMCRESKIPIAIGNAVTFKMALELLELGASAIFVGVGPGAACTTRGVLGIGVPQITATIDCCAARNEFFEKTGKYVSVITDGGMRQGGEICKAIASGADAVMIGSAFARAKESPGGGYHWGMATSHANLPRGTRIQVGTTGTLEQILLGPAVVDDGSQNLVGALKTSMGSLGVQTLREMQDVEMIIAPSIQTEGKVFQVNQRIGMGK